MNIKFLNITESEFLRKKLIYKYMPLEFALEIIKGKYLWLCNPASWKDPFEKRFIEAKYLVGGKELDFPLKGQLFCTCFTQTPTSEAHWNSYSDGQIGISLRIVRKQLLKVLEQNSTDYDIYIGKVNYLKTNELKKPISEIEHFKTMSSLNISNRRIQVNLLLLKRIAFQYENEIRILAVKKHKTKEHGVKLFHTIEPIELINTITIDPKAGCNIESTLKDVFKKEYGFKKVFKSQLYSMPNDIRIEI